MSFSISSSFGSPTKVSTKSITEIQEGLGIITTKFGMIQASNPAFLTNLVRPGDGAVVTNTTFNDGTYRIVAVLSQDIIVVAPGLTDETGGNVRIDTGTHDLTITDETVTDWDEIVRKKGPHFVNKLPSRGDNPYTLYIHAFNKIKIVKTAGGNTSWTSEREIVHCFQDGLTGAWEIEKLAADDGTLDLILGKLNDSGDRRSYDQGSVWTGMKWPRDVSGGNSDDFTLEAYSSFLSMGESVQRISLGVDGKVFGCIIHGDLFQPATTSAADAELQDCIIISDDEPIRIGDTIAHFENIIVAASADESLIQGGPAVVLSRILLADDAFSPAFLLNDVDADFRDLLVDVTPSNLFSITAATNATGRKSYTWTPRVVERHKPVDGGGSVKPLQSVEVAVKLVEIERMAFASFGDATPNSGDYTMTINGTAFTHNSGGAETREQVVDAVITLVNAGAEPVTAAKSQDGSEFGVHITPDDDEVAFTFEVSSTGSAWSARNNIIAVSGSPFTSAADGTIGDVVLETYLHETDPDDLQPFTRQLLALFTREDRQTFVLQRNVTTRIEEDITLMPWSPDGQNPLEFP